MMFHSFDLNLDQMTLILKPNLDMVKMYLHAKNEVPIHSSSKVIVWTDRQTASDCNNKTWFDYTHWDRRFATVAKHWEEK